MECIRDAIKDVSNELKQINFRLRYNDSLWFKTSLRTYKFNNCKTRLQTHVKNLESRHRMLLGVLNVENIMYKNESLEMIMSQVLIDTRQSVRQLYAAEPSSINSQHGEELTCDNGEPILLIRNVGKMEITNSD
jgi:hypothetical protein